VNGDGCGEDRVRASAFYRGQREVEAPVAASMAGHEGAITHSEEGGIYDRVKHATELRRGTSVGVAPWHGRGAARHPWLCGARGGGDGAAGSVRAGGRGRGARHGGPARPAWPLGAKKAGWSGWPLGRLGRKLKKNSFLIKIEFLNMPWLWKLAQGDLGAIWTQGFFLNSSRLLKYFRKMKYAMPCYATLGKN
jgi:hypothetical protein